MPEAAAVKTTHIKFLLPEQDLLRDGNNSSAEGTLPDVLGGRSRSGDKRHDPLLSERSVSVEAVYDLAGGHRSGKDTCGQQAIRSDHLLALEASDGTTLIVRADKLAADLQRLYPDKAITDSGSVDLFAALTDEEARARSLNEWIWARLSVLSLSTDGIIETAKDKALELLKEKLGESAEELVAANTSWMGAKALMGVIESRLEGEPGLYHWQQAQIRPQDKVDETDQLLTEAAANDRPILVFIHGIGSSTSKSFGGLHHGNDEGCWANLTQKFNGRIYGFEHPTFSASPLENALELALTLPKGSRISLVTHSRGGLIGDLLCLEALTEDIITRYQREPVLEESGIFQGKEHPQNTRLREAIVREEKKQLRRLITVLQEKEFKIERYMRVACPASGATLLSENLDFFLSSLLSLFNHAVSFIPAVGTIGGAVLSALRRIVLEIAQQRIDPRLIPGLEAMLPNSSLTILLAQACRREDVKMAVISGNTEGDSSNYLRRIAIMLTDWIVFEHLDNDFVVDTQSMRAGLARRNSTYEYYTQGSHVSHLSYFDHLETRHALCQWINADQPQDLPIFSPIPTDFDIKQDDHMARGAVAERATSLHADAPIVFYLPGVMGSHLEIRSTHQGAGEGDRIWFDPFHLAAGGIAQMSIDKNNVHPEGIFRRYYGELQNYLQRDHEVVTFAYDWRKSITGINGRKGSADLLADSIRTKLEAIREQPRRQVSILAHGMGGLVVRALIAAYPKLWQAIVESGGYFVMLGTPNHGSHAIVEALLGKSQSLRQLAMLDFQHDLQEIIEVVDDYEGILQLLPLTEFTDKQSEKTETTTALPSGFNYHDPASWDLIRQHNKDRWFPDLPTLGAKPHKDRLDRAARFWTILNKQDESGGLTHAERIIYIRGLDGHTPCGLGRAKESDTLTLQGTVQGDGFVTWASGKLDSIPAQNYWYMPVPHASLTNTARYFPALVALLRNGKTEQLEHKAPRTRSAASATYRYNAGPALRPGAEDMVLSFFGGRPIRNPVVDDTHTLAVSVRAMDLRFAQNPVMCGHYLGDSIAGAERQIDQALLQGALTQRERLGVYAGEVGTNIIVLNPRTREELKRGSGRGGIIIGLGEWDQVTVQKITRSVRDAVLEFLLHINEYLTEDETQAQDQSLTLNSLLVGNNSTKHITVEASVEAIVRGICEANQQYRYNQPKDQPVRAVRKLEFIEYFLDTAITAAYAVRDLPRRMEPDLQRLQARILPSPELQFKQGDGVRERLSELNSGGYWSRLMVTDADRDSQPCPESCYDSWIQPAIPKKVLDAVKRQLGTDPESDEPRSTAEQDMGVAENIKYVYLSERARAEAVRQQRQPGLIEALIRDSIRSSHYNPNLSRTLFQLMLPVDFKSVVREAGRLLMILDGYTANLPWEMLQADDKPLALKMCMVRQLVSTRFRRSVNSSLEKTACVIGNPSTADFHRHFDMGRDLQELRGQYDLVSLSGAAREAQEVAATLRNKAYEVAALYPDDPESRPHHTAIDVFNILFKKPYRILMIAAHGEVRIKSRRDGRTRTGVILSDGVMLTAAEIGQMEVVPDVVFLNCCYLARADTSPVTAQYNRLAYSVARELIEMGVRCVVAAGWAVEDAAAKTFSTTFFEYFTAGETFGSAVYQARLRTFEQYPGLNTWGAYQAYGDPNYVLNTDKDNNYQDEAWRPVAPQELISKLKSIKVDNKHRGQDSRTRSYQELVELMERCFTHVPPEWMALPGVQYQLMELYADILPEGFERARTACQKAIQYDDRVGEVPIKALETLGNIEARQAEVLSEQAEERRIKISQTDDREQAAILQQERERLLAAADNLLNSAIRRLHGLLAITSAVNQKAQDKPESEANTEGTDKPLYMINSERYALLASAYKRKAIVLIRHDEQTRHWEGEEGVKATLLQCHKYYKQGEGVSFDLDFNPYPTINRLQLEGILNLAEQHQNPVALAKKAQAAARRKFSDSLAFFDGVMAADAEVAIYLLDPAQTDTHRGEQSVVSFLIETYRDSVSSLAYSASEFDSVTQQLECLAVFLQMRAASDEGIGSDIMQANALAEVAAALKKL